jgi:hypothetical protein
MTASPITVIDPPTSVTLPLGNSYLFSKPASAFTFKEAKIKWVRLAILEKSLYFVICITITA